MNMSLISLGLLVGMTGVGCAGLDDAEAVDSSVSTDETSQVTHALVTHVTGTSPVTFVTMSGNETKPYNQSATSVVAYMRDSTTGAFTAYPGTGSADGTISVPNVPSGRIYLKLGSRYLVSTGRAFDLGSTEWGRDGTFVSLPTPVMVSATGLSPWQPADFLDMYSLNPGAFGHINGNATGFPLSGATSLSGLSFDYANMINPVLLDSGQGDVFSLAQMRLQSSANGVPYRAMHKVLDASVTQVEGQPVTVSGTFTQPVATGTFAVDWRRSAFEAMRTQVNPGAVSTYSEIWMSARPAALSSALGSISGSPVLVKLNPDSQRTDIVTGSMTYNNPLPATWQKVALAAAGFTKSYALGTATPYTMSVDIRMDQEASAFTAAPVQPLVGPVQAPLVNTRGAFQNLTGVGTDASLRWSKPLVGTATNYVVNIYRLGTSNGSTTATRVAVLHTDLQSVYLPPDVLQAGQTYFAEIQSWHQPGSDLATSPYKRSLPRGRASVLTGMFSP
ncbi:ABC transporter substrate-binding protein [Myxococcus sp. CA051A]|uniref:ABC transporter substrate-binding protein n=1 Tax=unclassified Myxococcus TaxID=2648731 RepID=UPI00157B1115|nr:MULTISPECIES: ABC transporter substrate-binding protein [unclassified Myxococcus]NTX10405.1 ABC transporter substrate-binding protein [Myxococcus sp. CA056]NTX38042.1 ABC transporter substrate-binding protein [Myxococcus sp. CA033]NTX55569.1 ABC transporter substrate-binding protein [Myxococcus sp. CA039A]NTX63197.1 ABC transporter substrate-binding protein [Myxococcus sp. CA051A]